MLRTMISVFEVTRDESVVSESELSDTKVCTEEGGRVLLTKMNDES